MKPRLIKGGIFTDKRGRLSFVNDFKFDKIERFYIINNPKEQSVRAWQGHKLDSKNFYCAQGAFLIAFVKVDNWEEPSKYLSVERIILKAEESNVLHIPAGYANAIKSLEENSKLISFSTLPLDRIAEDDIRFEENRWKVEE